MAAVDALLRLIASENADGMKLVAGQVPRLVKAGFSQPLSMPPVAPAVMEVFVGEVLAPGQRGEADGPDGVTVEYGEHTATVRHKDDSWELVFKKKPRRASPSPSPSPTPTPPPTPPPTPAPALLDRWLAHALADNASDLIVSAGRPARLRVANELVALPGPPLDGDALLTLVGAEHRAALERHGSTDVAWVWHGPDGESARFRVNVFRQATGLAAAFRPIRRDPPSLAGLGLPPGLERLVGFPNGLVLERYRQFGARVLRTDRDGSVWVSTDGERLEVRATSVTPPMLCAMVGGPC